MVNNFKKVIKYSYFFVVVFYKMYLIFLFQVKYVLFLVQKLINGMMYVIIYFVVCIFLNIQYSYFINSEGERECMVVDNVSGN